MAFQTHLRALRRRHHVSLTELAAHAGLSRQYVSRAELGVISATTRLEAQMSAALESVISRRRIELQSLEADCITFKGVLLKKEEHPNEQ